MEHFVRPSSCTRFIDDRFEHALRPLFPIFFSWSYNIGLVWPRSTNGRQPIIDDYCQLIVNQIVFRISFFFRLIELGTKLSNTLLRFQCNVM